jgi:hypothetical protein
MTPLGGRTAAAGEAPEPFGLRVERLWWDLPWWLRSPATLGVAWLIAVSACLVTFCLVVNGMVLRGEARNWTALDKPAVQPCDLSASKGRKPGCSTAALP